MSRPIAVILMPKHIADFVFDESDLERLRAHCELRDPRPEQVTPEWLIEQGRDATIWITGWGSAPLPEAALEAAENLKLIAHSAGSTKHLLMETPSFWRRGISIVSSNDVLAIDVAETTVGFLIASGKRLWQLAQHTRTGAWGWEEQRPHIKEFYRKTLGVVAAGSVGRHLLRIAQAFEMRRALYDPFVSAEQARQMGAEKVDDVVELARQSDYFAVCAPLMESTHHLINAEVLQALPDDCILVNPSRGAVVDEAALIAELQKGRLFACLDVTDPEPPAVDSPLRSLPNVVLTPHIAGSVRNGCQRLGANVVDESLRLLRGEPLLRPISREQWEIMA